MNRSNRASQSHRHETKTRLQPHSFETALPLALFIGLSLTFGSLTGCADPAADAPDAVVSEASTEVVAPIVDAKSYAIDTAASKVDFVGSKVTGVHEGGFELFEGTLSVSGGDPTTASVQVMIDATSVWSDSEQLTGHLKSEDFFSVEEFPTASFTSTEILATDTGYEIVGNLDLHGVEKQIRFPAEVTVTETSIQALAEFSINRFDFGIVYPGRKDDLIRDEVLIKLNLTANAT